MKMIVIVKMDIFYKNKNMKKFVYYVIKNVINV